MHFLKIEAANSQTWETHFSFDRKTTVSQPESESYIFQSIIFSERKLKAAIFLIGISAKN